MNYQELIVKALKKRGAKGDLSPNSKFKNMGLDSLDLMDMVIQLEDELNIRVPDDELEELNTIKDLVDLINKLKK
jgi:acyl carrier protein